MADSRWAAQLVGSRQTDLEGTSPANAPTSTPKLYNLLLPVLGIRMTCANRSSDLQVFRTGT